MGTSALCLGSLQKRDYLDGRLFKTVDSSSMALFFSHRIGQPSRRIIPYLGLVEERSKLLDDLI